MISEITISDVTTIISAVVVGVVTIIGALVAGYVSIRNSQKADTKKLDDIHTSTNGSLSKVTTELADLRKLVEKNAAKGVVTEPSEQK
jgi:mannose/fructose/N-acetylgalactosamine-specific phosphotransferase system component IID